MFSPVKIHGGKGRLYRWIIENFPANYQELVYVEPCMGAGSVILNKLPSKKEIVSDINMPLIQFWRMVKYDPYRTRKILKRYGYSEDVFLRAKEGELFHYWANEYIRLKQSRGGLGNTYSWSERLRGGQPESLNAWMSGLNNIEKASKRLSDVIIEYSSLFDRLSRLNSKDYFFYIDPPYLHSTRTSQSVYRHEMTDRDHKEILNYCINSSSKILISGYPSKLYREKLERLSNWSFIDKVVANNSGQGKTKQPRIERLWKNY